MNAKAGSTGSGPVETVSTYCRVCEPLCGLEADVADGVIVDLRPDRDHPVSRGYACRKGMAMLDLHRDPDRLNHPLRRAGGTLEASDWDTAASDIATRLAAIREQYGPSALAVYHGNPLGFNALGSMGVFSLFGQLRGFRFFSAGTQDCANKFAASQAVFGSRVVHPLPDMDHADVILVIGANPRVSHGSFISTANMLQRLREARTRGALVQFVNPARVEKAEDGVGETLQIRPDTDVYLLAGLLNELDQRGAWRDDILDAHANNVDGLRRFVADYPLDRAAEICGVEVGELRRLVDAIAAPNARTSVYCSTGLNMGSQGTIAYALIHALSMVTGNLDRTGGNVASAGFYPNAKSGKGDWAGNLEESEFGTFPQSTLPANLLSHYILDVDEPIRALVVAAGNPLLSVSGEDRLRKAFANLELLVVVDLYANATCEYAHWALPATDQFEREDLTVINLGLQYEPSVQWSPRVAEPMEQRKEEWWIFARIAQEMGLASALDGNGAAEFWGKYDHMLKASGLSIDALREMPHHTAVLDGLNPGGFYDDVVQHADARVDLWPEPFDMSIDRIAEQAETLTKLDPGQLLLIHKRDAWMHNSWMHNAERMHRGGRDNNPAYMHPRDAAGLGVGEGDMIELSNEFGLVELPVAFDEDLRPGVIAVVHGWGHAGAPGMSEARRAAGTNINRLLPIGPGSFDPLSSQAKMTGIPVTAKSLAST